MKLAYLIPEGQYAFFGELAAPLRDAGVGVVVNKIPADCDLILAGILPVTHGWIAPVRASGKPCVLWHWDLYSFTDYAEPRWAEFLRMLPGVLEVWSCTYEVARQLKEVTALDSHVMPAWVDGAALPGPEKVGDHVLYASSGGGFGKRVEWAQRACRLAGLELQLLGNQALPRRKYLSLLSRCRVYLMTAFEESNATVPALEAAACGRPVVLADLPASREVLGPPGTPGLYYFPAWDFGELLRQLKAAWRDGWQDFPGLRGRALECFDLPKVAARAARRLGELHAGLQAGAG